MKIRKFFEDTLGLATQDTNDIIRLLASLIIVFLFVVAGWITVEALTYRPEYKVIQSCSEDYECLLTVVSQKTGETYHLIDLEEASIDESEAN